MSNYRNLEVWKISMQTVKEIYQLTKYYPVEERFGLVSQSNRAAVSIPSNIAEGLGRKHKNETLHFLHISRGSAYELETLLNIAVSVNIIDTQVFERINAQIERNLQIINGYINFLKKATANG